DYSTPDEDPTFGPLESDPHLVLRPIRPSLGAKPVTFAISPMPGQTTGECVMHLPAIRVIEKAISGKDASRLDLNEAGAIVQTRALHRTVGVMYSPAGNITHAKIRNVVPGMCLDA